MWRGGGALWSQKEGLESRLGHLVTGEHGDPKGGWFLIYDRGYECQDVVRFRDNAGQIP